MEELKENVDIDYSIEKETQLLEWFWEIVRSLKGEEKTLLVYHWTGIPKVPPEGFEDYGLAIASPFSEEETRLFAQTCFKLLRLPIVKSKQLLEEAVATALATVKMGISIIED